MNSAGWTIRVRSLITIQSFRDKQAKSESTKWIQTGKMLWIPNWMNSQKLAKSLMKMWCLNTERTWQETGMYLQTWEYPDWDWEWELWLLDQCWTWNALNITQKTLICDLFHTQLSDENQTRAFKWLFNWWCSLPGDLHTHPVPSCQLYVFRVVGHHFINHLQLSGHKNSFMVVIITEYELRGGESPRVRTWWSLTQCVCFSHLEQFWSFKMFLHRLVWRLYSAQLYIILN